MYKLNEQGRYALETFLDAIAKPGFELDPIYEAATRIANEYFPVDEDAILELEPEKTQSGNTEVIQLFKSWFDHS